MGASGPAAVPDYPGAHARAVAEAAGRCIGRSVDKIEYTRLLKGQGAGYGEISAKTGIPKTSVHPYLQG